MTRPILCLSDTPYQLKVQRAANLPEAVYLHWNARGGAAPEAAGLTVFAGRGAFLTAALKGLLHAERVVIGDFRSTTQLAVILAAIATGRSTVIADDGLINHICDRWGYTRHNLSNGGVRRWKLPLIALVRGKLETAPRLSVFPKFTQRWSKAAYTLGSGERSARPAAAARRLVFIGQPCEITGIAPSAIKNTLQGLAWAFGDAAELIYAPHPRERDAETLAGPAWRLRPSVGPVEADPAFTDGATLWAGVTSTALLEVGGRGDRVLLADARELDYGIASRQHLHVQAQQVMCDIAAAEGMAQVELWSPRRGTFDG